MFTRYINTWSTQHQQFSIIEKLTKIDLVKKFIITKMYSENLIKSNLFPEISPNCEWIKYGEEDGQPFFYLIAFNPYNPLVSNDPTLNNKKTQWIQYSTNCWTSEVMLIQFFHSLGQVHFLFCLRLSLSINKAFR